MANEKQPEGRIVGMWMGICTALGAGIGVSLSIATETPGLIGVGPGIGAGIGVAVGASVEQRARREGRIRPLTVAERRQQRWAVLGGVVLLLIGVVLFVTLLVR